MGTNCAPLVMDLFLLCDERDYVMSLSDDKHVVIIDAFNTTSRYFGSAVAQWFECLTLDRGAAGSSLTAVTVMCP